MNTKKKIIKAINQLHDLKFNIGSEGNISFKKDSKVYVTPSGIKTTKLKTTELSEVSLDGKVINKKKPSSEILLHLLIYKNFSEVNSVVHCHSKWASILSCMQKNIPPFHYMIAEFGGKDIRCSKYATFGSEKLAIYVVNSLKNRKACLISNHGQITIGTSIEEAVDLSVALEKLCEQYYFCYLSKSTKLLSKAQIEEVIRLFKDYKVKY